MRILISGAGIAGMTLACWPHRQGDTPVIVERARRAGHGIGFGGTGFDIASRMGIAETLSSRQLPVESVHFVDEHGRPTATGTGAGRRDLALTVPGPDARRPGGSPHRHHRGGRGDPLWAHHHGHPPAARLGRGDHGRRHPRHRRPRRESRRLLLAHPRVGVRGRAELRSATGWPAIPSPTSSGSATSARTTANPDDTASVPRARRGDLPREILGGMGWLAPEVLERIPDPHNAFMVTLTPIVMPTWHDGRVALIGDARGCTTLASTQGVSTAMAAGYLLAQRLRAHPDGHRGTLTAHQESLRPHVRHRQRNARRFARGLVPATRAGLITAQKPVPRNVMRDAFAGLRRHQFGAATILPESETESRS